MMCRAERTRVKYSCLSTDTSRSPDGIFSGFAGAVSSLDGGFGVSPTDGALGRELFSGGFVPGLLTNPAAKSFAGVVPVEAAGASFLLEGLGMSPPNEERLSFFSTVVGVPMEFVLGVSLATAEPVLVFSAAAVLSSGFTSTGVGLCSPDFTPQKVNAGMLASRAAAVPQ